MASKALLVFTLLLAGAFLVNCAHQPQPYTDPADPSNDDPNAGNGSGYGNPAQQGQNPAQQEPNPAQQGQNPAQQEPNPAQQEPNPAQQEPNPAQQGQNPAQREPNPAQQGPTNPPQQVQNGGGAGGAGGYGDPWWNHPRRCRWGCCECGYYRCKRCC
uniref:Uncharacterized protein n=1 Tax=Oryza punctata TaxID=4537 RepID=A0A0E0K1P6_ORYPU